ncbi:hypothetical protein C4D60_Mb09t06710 [Musa balbisiana]|uniref:Uncharacterized protein n=1 Tax=Musa balbisiana TaxID=52838 RepID=A0A4S8IEH1_MUSBA|nr:hypothetical protein C4D60_Mb09t06710 [Musa balbisiana]
MKDMLLGGWVFDRETEEKPGRCSDPRLPPYSTEEPFYSNVADNRLWPLPYETRSSQGLSRKTLPLSPQACVQEPSDDEAECVLIDEACMEPTPSFEHRQMDRAVLTPWLGYVALRREVDKQITLLQYAHGMKWKATYLETLHDARNDLVLQTGVLPLGILPDHHNIHLLMPGRQSLEVEAMDERRVEIEFPSQLHVEGADPSAHRRPEAALEADLVHPDRLDNLRRAPWSCRRGLHRSRSRRCGECRSRNTRPRGGARRERGETMPATSRRRWRRSDGARLARIGFQGERKSN